MVALAAVAAATAALARTYSCSRSSDLSLSFLRYPSAAAPPPPPYSRLAAQLIHLLLLTPLIPLHYKHVRNGRGITTNWRGAREVTPPPPSFENLTPREPRNFATYLVVMIANMTSLSVLYMFKAPGPSGYVEIV
jgi:hypothetical protein